MSDPYRTPQPPREERPPRRLVVHVASEDGRSFRSALKTLLVGGVASCILGSATESPDVGWLSLTATAAMAVRARKRARRAGKLELRVQGRTLSIYAEDRPVPLAHAQVDDVADVRLRAKRRERVSLRAGVMAAIPGGEAPRLAIEEAQIVLVLRTTGETLLLPEPAPRVEVDEAFAKCRTFLRRHGWRPDDERAA